MKIFAALVFAPALAATATAASPPDYLMIDLSAGTNALSYPVVRLLAPPRAGWSPEYKTTKLVLRRIPPGSFTMGSPSNELGRAHNETPHKVSLSRPFYIGVFEITQKQWELVTGIQPSRFPGDTRPAERISYKMICGDSKGAHWPENDDVDRDSFLGLLRARTGLPLTLPTEAQWEYACRAGTETALNNGQNITNTIASENLNKLGRTDGNRSTAKGGFPEHTAVGSYAPNAWGLYDMHGNVWEWCRDWYAEDLGPDPVTDPRGPTNGVFRCRRGGSWAAIAQNCRSAFRASGYSSNYKYYVFNYYTGLRLALPADPTP